MQQCGCQRLRCDLRSFEVRDLQFQGQQRDGHREDAVAECFQAPGFFSAFSCAESGIRLQKLHIVQTLINSAAAHQFFVCAGFGDFTLIQHNDFIRAPYRR